MAGIERRAQSDTETFKGLLAINGGGALALLSFLAAIVNRSYMDALARAVLCGVLLMMLGLVAAVVYNHLLRQCSLLHERHNGNPPPGRLFWFGVSLPLPSPTVCFFARGCMCLSLAAFLLAGLIVAITGLRVI